MESILPRRFAGSRSPGAKGRDRRLPGASAAEPVPLRDGRGGGPGADHDVLVGEGAERLPDAGPVRARELLVVGQVDVPHAEPDPGGQRADALVQEAAGALDLAEGVVAPVLAVQDVVGPDRRVA